MIRNVSIDAAALPSSTASNNTHNNSEKLKLNTKKKKERSPVFPQRLYEMLEDAEQEGYSHLIRWSPDGRSFQICYDATKNSTNNKSLVEVLKRRFNQTHFKSFLRQLQLYGFERQFKGARKGECHHPLFQRHHKELLFGKSIEEYQDATCTQHAILATRMMCTNQQQQLELLSSSTQEVDTNLIPSPSPLQRQIASDEPTLSIGTSTSSNCKYRSTSPIPTTLKNLMLPDDDDDDDDDDDIDDDNQDNSNQDDYYDDDKNATTESNGSDNCSIDSNKVFNRTFLVQRQLQSQSQGSQRSC